MGETKTDLVYNQEIYIIFILTKRWQQSQINIIMTTVSQIGDIIWQKKKDESHFGLPWTTGRKLFTGIVHLTKARSQVQQDLCCEIRCVS